MSIEGSLQTLRARSSKRERLCYGQDAKGYVGYRGKRRMFKSGHVWGYLFTIYFNCVVVLFIKLTGSVHGGMGLSGLLYMGLRGSY